MVSNNMKSDLDNTSTDVEESEISMLIKRVDQLENTVNHITEQQGTLTHRLREHSENMEDFNESISELKNQFEELQKQSNLNKSRINGITRSLDSLEENIQNTKTNIEETSDKFDRRLTAIENMLELDEMDIAQAIKPNACELEQYTTIPEESREHEFDIRVQRAIAVYEQFNEISTPVKSGGRRLLSKEIKNFLSGYSKSSIAYSQVHRVIDSFIEKTDDQYISIQTEDGRAIVYTPNEKS